MILHFFADFSDKKSIKKIQPQTERAVFRKIRRALRGALLLAAVQLAARDGIPSMIVTKMAHCESCGETVEVTLNQPAKLRAAPVPLKCSRMGRCPRTAFCRLVNPLTVRMPVSYFPAPAAAMTDKAS